MNSGIINLAPLYEYLKKEKYSKEILNGKSEIGRGYSKEATILCESIATKPGIYLWGYYDKKKFWTNQYVGQASGKTNGTLKERLLKELKVERLFLWGNREDYDDVHKFACNHYSNQTKVKMHFDRACLKKGSTFILWYALDQVLKKKILDQLEADLIETLNPVGNKMRPTPNLGMHDIADTAKIIASFRDLIHSSR
jgi:hypothetical protein